MALPTFTLRGWLGAAALPAILLLSGCGDLPPPAPPQPAAAVAPGYPGVPPPFAGPLQIVGLQANPNPVPVKTWTEGYVFVYFNGAATRPGRVSISYQMPGYTIFTPLASERFVPGQTSVRVKFGMFGRDTTTMAVRATIDGQGDAAGYSGSISLLKQ